MEEKKIRITKSLRLEGFPGGEGIPRDFLVQHSRTSKGPTFSCKQGQLQQLAQNHVHFGFEYLHRYSYSIIHLDNMFQCLITLRVIIFFLCLNGITVFKYASCPDIEHQQEESGSNFLPPCIMSAYTLIGFPLSLEPSLFYRLNSCNSLSLSPYYKCFHPSIPFVALCWITSSISMSLLYSEA